MLKNKKVICVVIVIFVILLVVCGYVIYNKFFTGENIKYQDDLEEKSVITNIAVDQEDLNTVLKIIGVTSLSGNSNSCLNYYISNGSFSINFNNIISYYINAYGKDMLKKLPDEVSKSDVCNKGATNCYTISKKDAEYLLKIYNFVGDIDDYFDVNKQMKDDYIYVSNNDYGKCKYNIVHDMVVQYGNSNDINIVDNQRVKEYSPFYGENGKLVKVTEKEIIYKFKRDKENNYYLHNVIIEE